MTDKGLPESCSGHAQLSQDIALIKQEMSNNGDMTREILDIVKGNGNRIGLLTQTHLNKASIKRAWWWLGGISGSILGIFAWVVKKG